MNHGRARDAQGLLDLFYDTLQDEIVLVRKPRRREVSPKYMVEFYGGYHLSSAQMVGEVGKEPDFYAVRDVRTFRFKDFHRRFKYLGMVPKEKTQITYSDSVTQRWDDSKTRTMKPMVSRIEDEGMIILDSMGHLYSDTSVEELFDFAVRKLKLKPEWNHYGRHFPHFDLTTKKRSERRLPLEPCTWMFEMTSNGIKQSARCTHRG
jgi:hypothetical protein